MIMKNEETDFVPLVLDPVRVSITFPLAPGETTPAVYRGAAHMIETNSNPNLVTLHIDGAWTVEGPDYEPPEMGEDGVTAAGSKWMWGMGYAVLVCAAIALVCQLTLIVGKYFGFIQ